mmetsp:Transcript_3757/g.14248  ORF Transcript_3757/g.14248 Transcript_3757/m.14248 type:complete len:1252 (-) Transcript_3757:34-3789(-)
MSQYEPLIASSLVESHDGGAPSTHASHHGPITIKLSQKSLIQKIRLYLKPRLSVIRFEVSFLVREPAEEGLKEESPQEQSSEGSSADEDKHTLASDSVNLTQSENKSRFQLYGRVTCRGGYCKVDMSRITDPCRFLRIKWIGGAKNATASDERQVEGIQVVRYDIVASRNEDISSNSLSKKERTLLNDPILFPLYDKMLDLKQYLKWSVESDDVIGHQYVNDMLTYHQSLFRTMQVLQSQKQKCIKMEEYKHANRIKNQINQLKVENSHIWEDASSASGSSPQSQHRKKRSRGSRKHNSSSPKLMNSSRTSTSRASESRSSRYSSPPHMHHHHLSHHFLPPQSRSPYSDSHQHHAQGTMGSSHNQRTSTSSGEHGRYEPSMYHTMPYLPPMTNHFAPSAYPPTMPTFPSNGMPYNPSIHTTSSPPYGALNTGFPPPYTGYAPYPPPRDHFGPPGTSDGSHHTHHQLHSLYSHHHGVQYPASQVYHHVPYNNTVGSSTNRISTASSFSSKSPNYRELPQHMQQHHLNQHQSPYPSQSNGAYRRQTIGGPSDHMMLSHPPQMISLSETSTPDRRDPSRSTPNSPFVHPSKSPSSHQKSLGYETPSSKSSMYKDALLSQSTPSNGTDTLQSPFKSRTPSGGGHLRSPQRRLSITSDSSTWQTHDSSFYSQSSPNAFSPEYVKNKKIGQIVHSDEHSRYQSNLQRIRDAAKKILQEKAMKAQKPAFTKVLLDRSRLNEMLKKQKELDKEKMEKLKSDTKGQMQSPIQQITLTGPNAPVASDAVKSKGVKLTPTKSLKRPRKSSSGKSSVSSSPKRSVSRSNSQTKRKERKRHLAKDKEPAGSLKTSGTRTSSNKSSRSSHSNKSASNKSLNTEKSRQQKQSVKHESTVRKSQDPVQDMVKQEKIPAPSASHTAVQQRSRSKKRIIPPDAETAVTTSSAAASQKESSTLRNTASKTPALETSSASKPASKKPTTQKARTKRNTPIPPSAPTTRIEPAVSVIDTSKTVETAPSLPSEQAQQNSQFSLQGMKQTKKEHKSSNSRGAMAGTAPHKKGAQKPKQVTNTSPSQKAAAVVEGTKTNTQEATDATTESQPPSAQTSAIPKPTPNRAVPPRGRGAPKQRTRRNAGASSSTTQGNRQTIAHSSSKGSASSADIASESGGASSSTARSDAALASTRSANKATIESGVNSVKEAKKSSSLESSAPQTSKAAPQSSQSHSELSKIDAARKRRLLEKQKTAQETKKISPTKKRVPLHKR